MHGPSEAGAPDQEDTVTSTPRDTHLDRLALGSNCHQCGATTDEPCTTRRTGRPTDPHQARIDRAVAQYRTR